MKRPWEILAAGIVLGELVILAGSPLWAAGAGLAALLVMLLFLCRSSAPRFFTRRRTAASLFLRFRPAAVLFPAAAAAGMLRMAAAQAPGEQEQKLDEWMQAGEETGIEFSVGDIREDGDSLKLRSGCLLVYCSAEDLGELPRIGSRAAAFGKLARFPEAGNPGEFDAAAYYRAKGITHRLYADRISVTEPAGGFPVPAQMLLSLRRAAGQQLDRIFSEFCVGK